jgi:predicted permease
MTAPRVYAALLRLLVPAWLRRRAGDEMRATFAERLAAAGSARERRRELARELGGLLRVAVLARAARPASLPQERPPVLDGLRQDLAFALRSGRRHRTVAALATLTLAVGVGASTAMFSVIDGVLLRPLPFERPEQIILVNPTIEEWKNNPSLQSSWRDGRFSPPELRVWLATQRSFAAAGGYTSGSARVPNGAGSERIPIAHATAGLWTALRVRPLLGRLPSGDERDSVAVVSHAFWRSHLGGDSSAVGRDLRLNDQPVRVIGVLPPQFALVGVDADVWRPLALPPGDKGLGLHYLRALGRLRDGTTMAHAEQEMTRVLRGLDAAEPRHVTHGAYLVSPVALATRDLRVPLLILGGASVLLLVAACANVTLLLLGAGAERTRELAVRRALGARKGRVARQLLVESLALGVAGAAAGLVVAAGAVRLLVAIMPEGVPRIGDVGVDLHTFGVAALLAAATGALVGCFPALSLSRVDAAESLRSRVGAARTGPLQRGIVVTELALATVLLVGAGLLTRTMRELQAVRPGFAADGLFAVQLDLPRERLYPPGVDADAADAAAGAYVARLAEAVRGIPGVTGVAMTSDMPYSPDRGTNTVQPEGYVPAPGEVTDAGRRFVSGSYFAVMGIAAAQGRVLGPADDRADAERVMVVTDAFARHFWPDGRWVGRTVGFWDDTYRVVGVIAETREHDLRGDDDKFKFYVSGRGWGDAGSNLLLRTRVPAAQLVPVLRERIWAMDRSVVIEDAMPMTERIGRSLAEDRYRTRLMVAFSVAAAVFALLGVYGVMSRAVVRRRHELGVRSALGAQRRALLSLVLGDAARIGALGAASGIVVALAASRALERLLWGVPRLDPLTYVGAAAALLALSLAASLVPARRAGNVDPVTTLRADS